MNENIKFFKKGIRHGIPICLGYIAVSFSFGIATVTAGLALWQAVLISAVNLTSAGQFAALGIIGVGAPYFEMAAAQFVINLRYSLMSTALSQKLSEKTSFFHRFFIAFGVTDEIFAVSVITDGDLHPFYSYGLTVVSSFGWIFGTFLGAWSGEIMPTDILSALGVALYGMFIAIIVPSRKKANKLIGGVVIISMIMSLIFDYIPVLNVISSGFKIIILTIVIAGAAAVLFPIKENSNG